MKILILVPIWGRPRITKIFVSCLKWAKLDAQVLMILSKEDQDYSKNLELVKDYDHCIFKNEPLGKKLNAGIEYALDYDFDYLMNLGSDDLIHPSLFGLYRPFMEEKWQFFGLDKIYFYDIISGKLGLSLEYLWGAGRVISRQILEKLREKGEFLYKNEFFRGLDCNSIDKVKKLFNIDYKHLKSEDFPYIVDIKSEVGINDFILLQKFYREVDFEVLRPHYPNYILKMLKNE